MTKAEQKATAIRIIETRFERLENCISAGIPANNMRLEIGSIHSCIYFARETDMLTATEQKVFMNRLENIKHLL